MNKLLDSCSRLIKETIESARIATTPSMSKNQPRLTRKAEMVPKSGGSSYQHKADATSLSHLLESSRSLKL
jgi:hypothetical protein